jgi:hypothetical protein
MNKTAGSIVLFLIGLGIALLVSHTTFAIGLLTLSAIIAFNYDLLTVKLFSIVILTIVSILVVFFAGMILLFRPQSSPIGITHYPIQGNGPALPPIAKP